MTDELLLKTRAIPGKVAAQIFESEIGNGFSYETCRVGRVRIAEEIIEKESPLLKPGVKMILDYLEKQHIKLAVASSTSTEKTKEHLAASGIAELWVNGKPRVRKSLQKGASLGTDASIILGQEQDAFAGAFDRNQCVVGDIGDVNMWDFVLSPEEINAVYTGGTFSPNVLYWEELNYEANGEVFVKPQLW